ncbi:DUF4271 domain-containing protein [Psychroflexus sp. CAK57W]|uniref:DUF4271 domain-containing protein n=1 Tax=Psychroflexus curvus TaxID=2873595 RepID=UPI001CCC885C|nr:DUF4271 domain-containing protein [Psychroflexus curvus]MBZ9788299.1 DUF4271 domain-containing protein [Psychroflexus curvus]
MFSALRPVQDHHWVISIVLLILIFLVVVKWNKTNYIILFFNSLFSFTFYSGKFSEKRKIDLPEVLLFISSILGVSFFIFVIFNQEAFSILFYLQILFLVTIILLSKYFIEKIIGELFELNELIGRYLFYKQGILSWLGLFFLFPLGLLLYFQNIENSTLTLISIGISVLVYVFKLFSFVGLYQRNILAYWFYFILYLCAFEIAPYLIIFKVIKIN